jgi:hypothetical protein
MFSGNIDRADPPPPAFRSGGVLVFMVWFGFCGAAMEYFLTKIAFEFDC